MKLPKTTGAVIDALYKIRTERIEFQRKCDAEVAQMKAAETELKDHLIATLGKSSLDGAKGKLATVAVVRTTVPSVKDWPAVYEYVRENDAFDLFEKRLNKTAFRDRLEAGEAVPGCEVVEVVDLSLNKTSK